MYDIKILQKDGLYLFLWTCWLLRRVSVTEMKLFLGCMSQNTIIWKLRLQLISFPFVTTDLVILMLYNGVISNVEFI
jgi:hypothetical protein